MHICELLQRTSATDNRTPVGRPPYVLLRIRRRIESSLMETQVLERFDDAY